MDLKPDGGIDRGEGLYHVGIELNAGVLAKFGEGGLVGLGSAIAAIGRDGVEGVDDRDYSGADMDLFATKLEWISTSVPALLMLSYDHAPVYRQVPANNHLRSPCR